MKLLAVFLLLVFGSIHTNAQGPYAPKANDIGTDAIAFDNEKIVSWASDILLTRGFIDIVNKNLGFVNFGTKNDALGKSNGNAVSLGDSGVAVLSFNGWVTNGEGADFAVFENSFNHTFLELAHVEVSKDGINYTRFPSASETQFTTQISSFDNLEATNLNNLAGKYIAKFGTPFNLDDVGLDSIKFIRIVDVVGSIDSIHATKDSKGRIINDPYPTDFQNNGFYTGGFDLESVGLINYTGKSYLNTPLSAIDLQLSVNIYPNPSKGNLFLLTDKKWKLTLVNTKGIEKMELDLAKGENSINLDHLPKGMYFLVFFNKDKRFVSRLLLQ